MKRITLLIVLISWVFIVVAQENYKGIDTNREVRYYRAGAFYEVPLIQQVDVNQLPKNVIVMIGDGMGVAQVSAALFANRGNLFLTNFMYCGYSQTQSASDFITDSSAGGTALSTGTRTRNGYVAKDTAHQNLTTILEYAERKGLKTGLVSTSAVTHATPASFIAHQDARESYEDIALDFLKTEIDLFIGGGYNHFARRSDGKNLLDSLKNKGYFVSTTLDSIPEKCSAKIACLTAPEHTGRLSERKNMLPEATTIALENLSRDSAGFFLMVEGSQIDWGGHNNNTHYTIEETLDFDKAIGEALKFAANDGQTLIIVTADHETGGMSLLGGDVEKGFIHGGYSTGNHSGSMVPVFAYGPGAYRFTGIMKNTAIFHSVYDLLISESKGENFLKNGK